MNETLLKIFQNLQLMIFWGTAIYHLIMGALCFVSLGKLRQATSWLYALKVPENVDPRFEYGVRPLGAFALTVSLFCFRGALIHDPNYSSFLAIVLAMLFSLRTGARYFCRDLFERAFGVGLRRSLKNIFFNLFLSLVLLASAFLVPN